MIPYITSTVFLAHVLFSVSM